MKFAHLAEKSENGSISNLSTKVHAALPPRAPREGEAPGRAAPGREDGAHVLHVLRLDGHGRGLRLC